MTDPYRVPALGDVIECDMNFPTSHTYRVRLWTPDSVAFACKLVAAKRWRVVAATGAAADSTPPVQS
jgi:seryl-tRNA synthetase